MLTPKIISETKVVFGPCRLSYTHVFNKCLAPAAFPTHTYSTSTPRRVAQPRMVST